MQQIADKITYLKLFSLNVRQPYDALMIVLCSRAGLPSDVLAKLRTAARQSFELNELSYRSWRSRTAQER